MHRGKEMEIPFQISDLEFIIQEILLIFGSWSITFSIDGDMHSLQTELECTNDLMFNFN